MNAATAFRPVLQSLLETDLYKFTMWQVMLHKHPGVQAEYAFVCRNTSAFPLSELVDEVNAQLDHLCTLKFTADELDYLRSLRYIKPDFVDFLALFHYQRHLISATAEGDTLRIVAKGPQVHVMGFEIPVLAIVNELYFRRFDTPEARVEGRRRLAEKVQMLREFENEPPRRFSFDLADFGLRRRFSGDWQDEVVATLARELPQFLKGTSNVYLAKKHGLVPIGTMAHEFLQSYQAFESRLRDFQKAALEDWVQEYRGDLGIALTDVIGMDAFLADFDLYFAKLFDGARHDSGDPYIWGEKLIAHYRKMRVDPATKRMQFSDGLDVPKSLALYRHFADTNPCAFGIGTNLTNDLGIPALNIVMKLMSCNGSPVAKLSDSSGKTLCKDETYIAYLRQVFNHPVKAVAA